MMSTDATQTDAPTHITDRQAAIDSIFSSRETQLKEEVGEEFINQDEEVDHLPVNTDDSALSGDEHKEEEQQEEPKYKVKVDGEELELPLSEILKGYQKDQAASKRLEQVAKERQALEAEKELLRIQREELQQKQQPSDKPDAEKDVTDLYYRLVHSDEEDGVQALNELLSGRKKEVAIPKDEIVAEAANKAIMQMQYKNAERQFLMDNPDIAGDTTLFNIAMSVLDQTIPYSSTYDEAFTKAANETRAWLNKFSPKPDPVSEKVQRKQSMDIEPTKANTKAESFPEPKAETASEIIANMRKQRGLPV